MARAMKTQTRAVRIIRSWCPVTVVAASTGFEAEPFVEVIGCWCDSFAKGEVQSFVARPTCGCSSIRIGSSSSRFERSRAGDPSDRFS